MAKAVVTKELKEVKTTVEEDVYHLRLTRDEAIAVLSLTGKVSTATGSPRGKELSLAAQRVYVALTTTGKLCINDSRYLDGTSSTLNITDRPVDSYGAPYFGPSMLSLPSQEVPC